MYPADLSETLAWVKGGVRDWIVKKLGTFCRQVDSFFRYPPEFRRPCPNCGSFFCGPHERRERPSIAEATPPGNWDKVERGRRCADCGTVYGKAKSLEPHNPRWFKELVKRAHPHL